MSLLTFFAIFFAAVGDARFAVALPTHREHSSDGFGSDWRIGVAGGPAPAGPWNAAPAFGPSRSRLRTFAFAREEKRFPRCRRTGVVFRRSVHPPADPSTARRNRIGPLLIQGNTAAFADPELVPTHTTIHRARC